MKREIKFRAFDDGKMIYENDILHIRNEDNLVLRLARFWSNIRNDSQIMQFTGLLDKNGKDIYEGDLLQDFRKIFIYECVFRENGAFEFQNKTTLNFALLHDIWDNEVIGNIHENPELLNP